MTVTTFLDQKNHQQRVSSLRRKDRLWIYKNPQGLLILEDELNERRKKRFARQRMSPPIKEDTHNTTMNINETVEDNLIPIASVNKITSSIPDDAILPIAKTIMQDSQPTSTASVQKDNSSGQVATDKLRDETQPGKEAKQNERKVDVTTSKEKVGKLSLDKFLPKEQIAQKRKNEEQPAVKRNLISERSKLFQQQQQQQQSPVSSPKSEIVPKVSVSTSPKKEIIPKAFLPQSLKTDISPKTKQEIETKSTVQSLDVQHQKQELFPKAFLPQTSATKVSPTIKDESVSKPTIQAPQNSVDLQPKKKEFIPKAFLSQSAITEAPPKLKNENIPTSSIQTSQNFDDSHPRKKEFIPKAFRQDTPKAEILTKTSVSQSPTKEVTSKTFTPIEPKVSISMTPKKDIIPKAFQFESSRSEIVPKSTQKVLNEQIKPSSSSPKLFTTQKFNQRSPSSTPQQNFLSDAKKKLSSVQNRSLTSETPSVNKRGLVSTFISALESPNEQKVTDKGIFPRSTSPPNSKAPQPPKHMEFPPAATNVNPKVMPKAQSPFLDSRSSSKSSITSMDKIKRKQVADFDRIPTPPLESTQFERNTVSRTSSPSSDSTINVYLPRLSPDISFNEQDHQLSVPEEDIYDQGRPVIKKRVSFSEELTIIPDTKPFSETLNQELSETKKQLVQERRVNTTPSREPFIPANPQRLSNRLLDMFQQKPKPQPVQQTPPSVQTSQPVQPLVHLTKTRPRKPPSLKKPTFPAATAQPNWRNRATNKKYEFVL